MEALLMRFEEPSSMARWDSPLFTVAWDDATLPFDEIWTTLTTGTKKKANTSTVPVCLSPSRFLILPLSHLPLVDHSPSFAIPFVHPQNGQTAPSTIETLHTTTSSSITYLLEHLSHSPLSPHVTIPPPFPPSGLSLPQRTITLSELQRLKRQFESIQMAGFSRGGAGVLRAGWGEREWAEAWVSFLQMQWETS
jgi:protein KTI12